MNGESKLSNDCSRLDSLVGVSNVNYYNCDTLPSQVPVRKTEHESTAKINLLLDIIVVTEISGP